MFFRHRSQQSQVHPLTITFTSSKTHGSHSDQPHTGTAIFPWTDTAHNTANVTVFFFMNLLNTSNNWVKCFTFEQEVQPWHTSSTLGVWCLKSFLTRIMQSFMCQQPSPGMDHWRRRGTPISQSAQKEYQHLLIRRVYCKHVHYWRCDNKERLWHLHKLCLPGCTIHEIGVSEASLPRRPLFHHLFTIDLILISGLWVD